MQAFDALSLDPAVAKVIAVALALLFAKAAFDKFADLPRFRGILDAYELLPSALVSFATPVVPIIETLTAAMLLVGCLNEAARPGAGLVAAGLLGAYAVAIGINILRGRETLDCGCAPAGEQRPIGAWMAARSGVLALLALVSTLPGSPRELGLVDAPLLVGGIIACVALYSTLDQLWGKVAPVTAMLRGSR